MTTTWIFRLSKTLSATGLLLGTLFFAASLTPSLVPRTALMQGVLSGISFAAGYGCGAVGAWLWTYLELPAPPARAARAITLVAAAACAAVALFFLWHAAGWQTSIRMRMGMPPAPRTEPLQVAGIAAGMFAALVLLARLVRQVVVLSMRGFRRLVPRRISSVVGTAVAVALLWALVDGVLLELGMRAADNSFRQVDALVEPGRDPPSDSRRTGGPASLVAWEDLGWRGRDFVASGPDKQRLDRFLDTPARRPIRVYVGLASADTPEERAGLALAEMIRVGAFDRSALVVATPPGTGWVDPAAMNTVEYLHRGDIASVAVQYSYLPSWLSLLVEPEYGAETARALFTRVYEHWTRLPQDDRPELYLFGLSLGALNSDRSTDLLKVIGDPFDGALWSGPPFASETWQTATENRRPDSPAWLPQFREGTVIRFSNQWTTPARQDTEWGPMRIVFLQYGSDPVTFFDAAAFYRAPAWMAYPRAPDVSPEFRWYPIVTFLQLVVDLASATTTPIGYGHVYAAEDYIDAWLAVTAPEGWTADDIERLKDLHAGRGTPVGAEGAR